MFDGATRYYFLILCHYRNGGTGAEQNKLFLYGRGSYEARTSRLYAG